MPTFAAVDLGATSGRVVNVHIDDRTIELDVVRRFPTRSIAGPGGALAWDFDTLLDEVRCGLIDAARRSPLTSVAVDGWGVDYGLLDATGRRLGPVHAYRSSRTDGVMDAVIERVGRELIYRVTGGQFLPINTAYQLVAARDTVEYQDASLLLMLPDLVNHALCGSTTNDVTDASTTQLLDVARRAWSDDLVAALSLRRDLLPDLHEPGAELGLVRGIDPAVNGLRVVAAASHDTASAVAGTPLRTGSADVYISCGTWALVGCELPAPVTTSAALAANVTNELGVEGSVRLLKNVTGLWLLEECRRRWSANGAEVSMQELIAAAEDVPGGRSVVDPDDPRFASPGDLPTRLAAACAESGQPVPSSPPEFARLILDSLALAWRATVHTIEQVRGTTAEQVHLVGGGSAIPLLGRLCASACGRPVLAGPAEATVAGNAIVQAIAHGVLDDVGAGRRLVARALPPTLVRPEPTLEWDELASRLADAPASGRLGRRDRRRPHDQLGMEQHLLVNVRVVGIALGEQQLRCRATEQLPRLTDRTERDRRGAGELDVVIAHDRQLARDIHAHPGHLLQQAQGEQIVGAERGGRPPRPWQPDQTFACPPTLSHARRRRLEDQERVGGEPACRDCPAAPLEAIDHLHRGHRTTDERDPLVSLLAEVGDGQHAAFDIVDSDAAPARSAGAIDEDHRDPLPQHHVQRRRVLIDRRDQNAADALLLQQVQVFTLPARVAVAVADEHGHPVSPGDLLDPLRHIGEERVGGVEHHVRDRPAAAGSQLTARLVAHETKLGDRLKHPGLRGVRHQLRPVQHVRDRPYRHARPCSDVLDPHRVAPH